MYVKSQLVHGFDPRSFDRVSLADSATRPPTLHELIKETTDNRSMRIGTIKTGDFDRDKVLNENGRRTMARF